MIASQREVYEIVVQAIGTKEVLAKQRQVDKLARSSKEAAGALTKMSGSMDGMKRFAIGSDQPPPPPGSCIVTEIKPLKTLILVRGS